jgi:hypothetical protein
LLRSILLGTVGHAARAGGAVVVGVGRGGHHGRLLARARTDRGRRGVQPLYAGLHPPHLHVQRLNGRRDVPHVVNQVHRPRRRRRRSHGQRIVVPVRQPCGPEAVTLRLPDTLPSPSDLQPT